jgi:uncharacterized SAM-binding protein YcdF (DUF218 family)
MKSLYDAILIPGGGVDNNGNVTPWVLNRLDKAIQLYQERLCHYVIALSAGTTHKPLPTDKKGYPIFESEAAARYLIKKGIDSQNIMTETASYDTIGNAYFSRMIHTEPRGFKELLVITSQFHMPRTKKIFLWVYGLKSTISTRPIPYRLHFQSVPDQDESLSAQAIQARLTKEVNGLERIKQKSEEINNLESFHHWLYTRHGAYAAAREPVRIKGSILSTY